MLKPMFKYPGGKSRELKIINNLLPVSYLRIIEPFVGGGAFFLSKDKPAVIADNNQLVINFYNVVKDKVLFDELFQKYENNKNIINPSNLSKQQLRNTTGNLCNLFYKSRDLINTNFTTPNVEIAFAFLCVRQLCFSGMHRQDANGKYNVPYGWYQKLSINLKEEHHKRLQNVDIHFGSFEKILKNLEEDDFVFLDPPYLNRAGYKDEAGSKDEKMHIKLFDLLKEAKYKWLLVHTDIEFYKNLYKDFHIVSKEHTYSQRFGKNKNHNSAFTKHLYIKNY